MNRVIVDLKAFALQYMRNPFGAFFSIGFPLLLLVTFGAMFTPADPPEVHLVVQDLDGTLASGHLIDVLNWTAENRSGVFMTYMAEPTDTIDQESITKFELTGALVIPAGFQADGLNATPIDLILHVDKEDGTHDITIETVSDAVEVFEGNLTFPDGTIGFKKRNIISGEFVFIDFFLPGLIAVAIMLNCLMILSSLAAEYWQKGYFKLLKTTPLRKWEWIMSKLIWYVIIMGISIFLMLAIGVGVLDARTNITAIAVVLILSGILLFSSMGLIIGAWAKNSDTAAGIGNAVGQPMMFLSGIFWRLDDMPEAIQTIGKVFPLTYLGEGLRQTMIFNNADDALYNLAIVLVMAVAFFIAASYLISWKEK